MSGANKNHKKMTSSDHFKLKFPANSKVMSRKDQEDDSVTTKALQDYLTRQNESSHNSYSSGRRRSSTPSRSKSPVNHFAAYFQGGSGHVNTYNSSSFQENISYPHDLPSNNFTQLKSNSNFSPFSFNRYGSSK